MEIDISIIIPAYNAELSIGRCLDSIISQKFENVEIICVDDGSKDGTVEVIKSYIKTDNRIQLIQQSNQYAGIARNNGMAKAAGKYLLFMDADDYFLPGALQAMYDKIVATGADICVCGGDQYLTKQDLQFHCNGYMNNKRIPESEVWNRKTNEKFIMNFTCIAAWNKLFRKDFVLENKLNFQSYKVANDAFFVEAALCLAEKITTVNKPLICHVVDYSESLTSQSGENYKCMINAWGDIRDFLMKENAFPKQSYDNCIVAMLYALAGRIKKTEDFNGLFELLKENGADRLGLEIHEPDYYYVEWYGDFLKSLCTYDPASFLTFFSSLNYYQKIVNSAEKRVELKKSKALRSKLNKQKEINAKLEDKNTQLKDRNDQLKDQNDQLKEKNKQLKNNYLKIVKSKEYHIGSIILWIPRRIKKLFKF